MQEDSVVPQIGIFRSAKSSALRRNSWAPKNIYSNDLIVQHNKTAQHRVPALPKDSFRRGSIKGMLARTYATVDELVWDLDEGVIVLHITSRVDQEVTACCRLAFNGFECEGATYGPGSAGLYRQV